MNPQTVVRTAFDRAFDSIVPHGGQIIPMPGGWDIAGGDGPGWGRGLAGLVWSEAAGGVTFSDTGHARRLVWVPGHDPEQVAGPRRASTGAAVDQSGRLVLCDWEERCVFAVRGGGADEVELVAANCDGKRFNRPGDICTGPNGSLFFIDQNLPFPRTAGDDTWPTSAVYRIDAAGGIVRLPVDIALPGGLAHDAQGGRLLVTAPRAQRILAFDLAADGSIRPGPGRVLAELAGEGAGAPHGLALDSAGRIYTGGPGGIWVLAPDGSPIGIVHLTASRVTSLAIGGGRLFAATPTGLGAIDLAPGVSAAGQAIGAPAVLRQPIGFSQGIERHDPALDRIIAPDAVLINHGSGGFFEDLGGGEHENYSRSLEGLIWDSRKNCLLFSDIGNSRRLQLHPSSGEISLFNRPTDHTNGATFDAHGQILSCEQAGRRITRLLPNGDRVIVADRTTDGHRLNRPNDIVVRSDGNIYFTDPWWDFGAGEERDADDGLVGDFAPGMAKTRRIRPDGVLETFGSDWMACNGLALSVDEQTLFVNDTIRMHIRAYDLLPDGTVDEASNRVFCELPGTEHGKPDGMKLDLAGNIFCGGPGGVWVIDPAGKHLGTIRHGATQTNNLCFGGPDWTHLYLCSWTALFSLEVLIPGVRSLDARGS
jgi:gluconolactonase